MEGDEDVHTPPRRGKEESEHTGVSPLLSEVVEGYLTHSTSPSSYFQVTRARSYSSDSQLSSPTLSRVQSTVNEVIHSALFGETDLDRAFFGRIDRYSSPSSAEAPKRAPKGSPKGLPISPKLGYVNVNLLQSAEEMDEEVEGLIDRNEFERETRSTSKSGGEGEEGSPREEKSVGEEGEVRRPTFTSTLASSDRAQQESCGMSVEEGLQRTPVKEDIGMEDAINQSPYLAHNAEKIGKGEEGEGEGSEDERHSRNEFKRKRSSSLEEGKKKSGRAVDEAATLVEGVDSLTVGSDGHRLKDKSPRLSKSQSKEEQMAGEDVRESGAAAQVKRQLEGGEEREFAYKGVKETKRHTESMEDSSKMVERPVPFASLPREVRNTIDEAISLLAKSRNPAKLESREELEKEKQAVKSVLRKYDSVFEKCTGHLPGRAEKEPVRPLYTRYNLLRQLIKDFGGETSMSATRRSSLVNEDTLRLGRTTLRDEDREDMISSFKLMSISELELEKKAVKDELKNFDKIFERFHNRLPTKTEKEPMRPLYERYNLIKEVMKERSP
uniref:FAM13A-like domain-containing protein n=1 Tax=Palpitomonas bilix TaxID=652834 RepID=A0A7S3FZM5_9EUKA|mmetsp:Transcript_13119/g.34311  ORF Transcript_13119/g.34311 Transcript_13119/m.34311 type:complete len:554 (+) Transcript_13119:51-1712(+)